MARPLETERNNSAAEYQDIQTEIVKLFTNMLSVHVPSTTTDLLDTGILDSQKFVELLLHLEQKLGAKIDIADFEPDNFRSIETITNLVFHTNSRRFVPEATMALASTSTSVEPLQATANDQASTACNLVEAAYPRNSLVPQLIAEQSLVWPQGEALIACGEIVTYSELDKRSNRMAHYLRTLGVGPDTLVGVCLGRSIQQVVSALGILKAGGAYLPLDPKHPVERLSFMLKDAEVQVLITTQQFAERIPSERWRVISLDADESAILRYPTDPPGHSASQKNLAYVIYTSGSTGLPKGVEITHGGLANLVFWHQEAFGLKPTDRATQLASPGFDAAVWELWPYLTVGASVCLPGDSVINEPESLRNWIVAQGITMAFVPTPLAERMIALEWPSETALRILLTGADTLHRYPPRGLPFTLINNYGPTECTVVATSGPVLPDDHAAQLPTIGRPIENTQIYLLSEQMQEVPVGEPGEIYIGGAGVARGYRNRPDLTAERFVPNPFDSKRNTRLYKTGDVGRYLPDGQIAFLGRVDEQVKIRGFRIEPAEIVRVLDEHPGIEASAVLARELSPGESRLIAYVVPTKEAQLTNSELHNSIAARLPEYMIPATFVKVNALPLNKNGKVDRTALPEPEAENTLRDKFVQPRTLIEGRVAAILAELLNLKQVSAEDNFFLLGGHSLLGTQLIARVRDGFGVELSLRSLFDAPTVSKLAAQVEALLLAKLEAMSEDEAQRLLDA